MNGTVRLPTAGGIAAIMAALLTVAVGLVAGVADPVAAWSGDTPSAGLTEVPGVFVVETVDGHAGNVGRDPSGSGIDHSAVGHERAALNARVAEIVAEIRSGWEAEGTGPGTDAGPDIDAGPGRPDTGPAAGGFLVNGGISVTYNPSKPTPAVAKPAIEAAIATWNNKLSTRGAPVVTQVSWTSFGDPSVLGFAGPSNFIFGTELPSSHMYPAAMANVLTGGDTNGSKPEIVVTLNSDLHTNGTWHYGNGAPPPDTIDLQSAMTHELTHGLGFVSSAGTDSGGLAFASNPFVYDLQGIYQGKPVINASNVAAALTSSNVQVKISSTQTGPLYTPSVWLQGTSFSHFEPATGSLTVPSLVTGTTKRGVDGLTLGVLEQMGWPTTEKPITPLLTGKSVQGTTVTVDWKANNAGQGLPASSFRIQARVNGSVVGSTIVPGSARTGTIGGLAATTTHEIRIIPIRDGIAGTAAATIVTTGASPKPVAGDRALDGQIIRVYQAHLSRDPDPSGFGFWLDQRARGLPLVDMIGEFQSSTEFIRTYGSLTNRQFVILVYRNVLGRSPDAAGLDHWVSLLNSGVSRAEVTEGFIESAEFVRRTNTAAPYSSNEGSIRRLYLAFFLRQAPSSDLEYWTSVNNGGTSLVSIAGYFATSTEFRNRYGTLSNGQFVSLVYQNVLGRSPDSAGFGFWLERLGAGMTRGEMMVGFSESVEFIKSTGTIP